MKKRPSLNNFASTSFLNCLANPTCEYHPRYSNEQLKGFCSHDADVSRLTGSRLTSTFAYYCLFVNDAKCGVTEEVISADLIFGGPTLLCEVNLYCVRALKEGA